MESNRLMKSNYSLSSKAKQRLLLGCFALVMLLTVLSRSLTSVVQPWNPKVIFEIINYSTAATDATFAPSHENLSARDCPIIEFRPNETAVERSVDPALPTTFVSLRLSVVDNELIAFDSFSGNPHLFCRAIFENGTCAMIYYPSMLSGAPHLTKQSMDISLALPTGTKSWKVGFSGWRPSFRQLLWRRIGSFAEYVPNLFWKMLPSPKQADFKEFWSDEFKVLGN